MYEKYAKIRVCIYIHSANSIAILLVWMTWKRAAYVCRTNLWRPTTISWQLLAYFCIRKHAASVGLRHARMNVSAGPSDAYASLSLLVRLFTCCKSQRNISSRFCHVALWAALRSHTSLFRLACMPILIRKRWYTSVSYTMIKSVLLWRTLSFTIIAN